MISEKSLKSFHRRITCLEFYLRKIILSGGWGKRGGQESISAIQVRDKYSSLVRDDDGQDWHKVSGMEGSGSAWDIWQIESIELGYI